MFSNVSPRKEISYSIGSSCGSLEENHCVRNFSVTFQETATACSARKTLIPQRDARRGPARPPVSNPAAMLSRKFTACRLSVHRPAMTSWFFSHGLVRWLATQVAVENQPMPLRIGPDRAVPMVVGKAEHYSNEFGRPQLNVKWKRFGRIAKPFSGCL